MPEGCVAGVRFVVMDHDKVIDTVEKVVGAKEACHFCGAAPIVIIYRDENDKITTACEAHREIVEEMIERAKL